MLKPSPQYERTCSEPLTWPLLIMPRDSANSIHPEDILKAYTLGYFPMARSHDEQNAMWVLPEERGVLLPEAARLPRKLRKSVARDPFHITANQAFEQVIEQCAARGEGPGERVRADRMETWINDQILDVYTQLHRMGFAHSLECWENDVLVGGLYGLSLGGVFFGESMFSRRTDASKIAFAHLIGRLKISGYCLIDTQFYTPHLAQFGVVEIEDSDYQILLQDGLMQHADYPVADNHSVSLSTSRVLQSITQTS